MASTQTSETVVVDKGPEGISDTEQQLLAQARKISTVDKMRAHFAAQPKRRVKIRKESGPAPVFVSVNGYSFTVPVGVPVEVPEQVAQMLEEGDYI